MKVLLISTAIFEVPPKRYSGIERLIYDYCAELVQLGVDVSLAAPEGSKPPKGVELITTVSNRRGFALEEEAAWFNYADRIKDFDCIHDFSHQKIAAFRSAQSLPAIYITWFEPVWFTEQRGGKLHPMPPYNIVCLSQYQTRRFRQVYGYNARYQPTICKDPEKYKFKKDKSERFLFVGKMSWHKGAREAIKFCKDLGVPLDVCGGKGVGDPTYYQDEVLKECDGEQICFYPNVTDDVKIRLMQHAKAVLYPVQFTEAHNMVLVESMMCGTPVVTFDKGAMREVVGEWGGFAAKDDGEFKQAMKKVEELDPTMVHAYAVDRYARSKVVADYLKLYKSVASGERWR